ncbi:hypothetical protein BDBG_18068 [Blastomyces gilchristii SLH14081]|uniref:Uncharacterized protein n=1 Tax=Blastomyces gilchristii (strain SLH14081) TaxID=559298 RepID=A0A179V4W2_BLAGS|nr:uncharacterized protein BDBG_18068 [Blastomyces gilchristii SLH14081]OAT14518.1 hypothetical protein BDBG_18068 [Blastomyces gilchristii SLH14081]
MSFLATLGRSTERDLLIWFQNCSEVAVRVHFVLVPTFPIFACFAVAYIPSPMIDFSGPSTSAVTASPFPAPALVKLYTLLSFSCGPFPHKPPFFPFFYSPPPRIRQLAALPFPLKLTAWSPKSPNYWSVHPPGIIYTTPTLCKDAIYTTDVFACYVTRDW